MSNLYYFIVWPHLPYQKESRNTVSLISSSSKRSPSNLDWEVVYILGWVVMITTSCLPVSRFWRSAGTVRTRPKSDPAPIRNCWQSLKGLWKVRDSNGIEDFFFSRLIVQSNLVSMKFDRRYISCYPNSASTEFRINLPFN